jgi:hypothetical protein
MPNQTHLRTEISVQEALNPKLALTNQRLEPCRILAVSSRGVLPRVRPVAPKRNVAQGLIELAIFQILGCHDPCTPRSIDEPLEFDLSRGPGVGRPCGRNRLLGVLARESDTVD